jgi:2-keto-4-pentenoate hydratase/2-oxohepta-3-ene-1,7-dioic acid hydratase in catechol pathway
MKIAQYYTDNQVRLGIIQDTEHLMPIDFQGDMMEFIMDAPEYSPVGSSIPLNEVSFAPPVTQPPKIMAIGLNYSEHIKEGHAKAPENPVVFSKLLNSLTGHKAQITWNPALTNEVDFEAELAVIIGKKSQGGQEEDIMDLVFGYTCGNDVSARNLQFGDRQWVRGKSLDTFCPLGPWIVTRDEIPDPNSLEIKSWLNGELMQSSNTSQMIFNIPSLLKFLSKSFTLTPGDVIMTGTPDGVGAFRDPPIYMKEGDEIIIDIEAIGKLENTCKTVKEGKR